jgi:hypothetical protein
MLNLRHEIDEASEEGRYLLACARIRDCTPTTLVKRLLAAVLKDHLVLSILDDDSKPERRKGQHGYSIRHAGPTV